MSRQKQRKFTENWNRPNILEPDKEGYETVKGTWHSDVFKNNNPITLELACGRGEYTIGMSRLFSDRNFIGVDIKGDRLWMGSGIAIEENLSNAFFLRTEILLLEKFFDKKEVNEIWVVFPDPRPRKRDAKRRLTHDRFLDIYKSIMGPGGIVRLKTDSTELYEFTKEIAGNRTDIEDYVFTDDLYNSEYRNECHDIVTKYEKMFTEEGSVIKYLRFTFK